MYLPRMGCSYYLILPNDWAISLGQWLRNFPQYFNRPINLGWGCKNADAQAYRAAAIKRPHLPM